MSVAVGSSAGPHVLVKPEAAGNAAVAAPAAASYTKQGSTAHFEVYYETALATGSALAEALLATCEQDYAALRAWFDGITPIGLPFTIYIDTGEFGAYHANCAATAIHVAAFAGNNNDLVRMLMVAEVDEVMMAAQNAGWNCGASAGEGLSRVLATERYPAQLDGFASAASWLESNRPDWITNTEPTDQDYVSIGCATLFINYLQHQLGYSLTYIIGKAAPTLGEIFTKMTGHSDGAARFIALMEKRFPRGQPCGLTSDNPFPIANAYQTRIMETGTTFAQEVDGTWLMVDYDRDGIPDLVFIKTANTGTGKVEVHVASGASNYQTRILETGTTFAPENDGTWLMVDYDRDGIPDLVFIKTANTGTGKVEVHVASGASNYQTRILETGTTFAPENDGTWLMVDYDRDGIPDLVFIKTANTGTGKVEVHVASGASNYQTRILETGTTFAPENDGTWSMADYDRDGIPDLVFIKTANTGTGKVEVHVASGASNYQTRILETGTTFAPENDGTWLMTPYDRGGLVALIFIKTANAGTDKVEVHVSPAA